MLIATDDNRIIDTDDYSSDMKYEEEIIWIGWESVGRFSQFSRDYAKQTLYPCLDRYYVVAITFDNKVQFAKRLSSEQAILWLLYNNHHDLPGELMKIAKSHVVSPLTKPIS